MDRRTSQSIVSASLAVLASLIVGTPGCGDDDFYGPYGIVGGACRGDLDCAPGVRCEHGGSFPDGTCALPCRDHLDCPAGTACVDVAGGVCLVACVSDFDCRVSYRCRSRDDRDDNGESRVCIH